MNFDGGLNKYLYTTDNSQFFRVKYLSVIFLSGKFDLAYDHFVVLQVAMSQINNILIGKCETD